MAEWDIYESDEPTPLEIWTPMYGATAEQLAEACQPQDGDSPGMLALKQRSHDYERLLVDIRAKANARITELEAENARLRQRLESVESAAVEYVCPHCGAVSHNPNDLRFRYCAACGRFAEDAPASS